METDTQYKPQAYRQGIVALGSLRSRRESSSGLETHMPRVSLWDSMNPEDRARAAALVIQNDSLYW